jgi:hypothetical protein
VLPCEGQSAGKNRAQENNISETYSPLTAKGEMMKLLESEKMF